MFYLVHFNDGEERTGEFDRYEDALDWAEHRCSGRKFILEEYTSEDDYEANVEPLKTLFGC